MAEAMAEGNAEAEVRTATINVAAAMAVAATTVAAVGPGARRNAPLGDALAGAVPRRWCAAVGSRSHSEPHATCRPAIHGSFATAS